MSIEIKKSTKPIKYKDAIAQLEARLKLVDENEGNELIWILEHEPIYTAGTSYSKNDIIDESINIYETNRGGKKCTPTHAFFARRRRLPSYCRRF